MDKSQQVKDLMLLEIGDSIERAMGAMKSMSTYEDLKQARDRAEAEVGLLQSTIKQLERDLTVKTANANAWKKEYDKLKEVNKDLEERADSLVATTQRLKREGSESSDAYQEAVLEAENAKLRKDKERLTGLEIQLRDKIWELKEEAPTMPVIPKAVAIAIFREGVQHGVEAACTELDEATCIRIEESEYVGDFEVSFERDIDLNDHIDTDWMRGKCGDYSEERAIEALGHLCAAEKFECRIHGIDDQEEKKND